MEPWGALVTGTVAGMTFEAWSEGIFYAGVDDPLDAVAVHLGGGLWGIKAAPLFATRLGVFYNWDARAFQFLLWNIIGAQVICAWASVLTGGMFWIMRFAKVLRVSRETETTGLDEVEHGEKAYEPDLIGVLQEMNEKQSRSKYSSKEELGQANKNFKAEEL